MRIPKPVYIKIITLPTKKPLYRHTSEVEPSSFLWIKSSHRASRTCSPPQCRHTYPKSKVGVIQSWTTFASKAFLFHQKSFNDIGNIGSSLDVHLTQISPFSICLTSRYLRRDTDSFPPSPLDQKFTKIKSHATVNGR